ncbi:MAG: hypothetical protein Kow00129_15470 [Thermoleophilia bacterium]
MSSEQEAGGALPALFAFGGGLAAAIAAGYALPRLFRESRSSSGGHLGPDPEGGEASPEVPSAVGSAFTDDAASFSAPVTARLEAAGRDDSVEYEYCARVIWSDQVGGTFTDLEDTEAVEPFVRQGWELIDVIVPFAETRELRLSYPGNTRKLIGYFRRPKSESGEERG